MTAASHKRRAAERRAAAFLALLLIAGWTWIFYNECVTEAFISDVPAHVYIALHDTSYSLGYLIVRLLYTCTADVRLSGCLLTLLLSVCSMTEVVTCAMMVRRLVPTLSRTQSLLAAELSALFGPWLVPGIQTGLYAQAINGNAYHNLTLIFSRALLPLTIVAFLNCWKARCGRIALRDWFTLCITLLISTSCKPSFAFAFLPLLAVLLLWDFLSSHAGNWSSDLYLGCAVLPAGMVCLAQFFILYLSKESTTPSSIALFLPNGEAALLRLLSLLRSFLFPLFAMLLLSRTHPNRGEFRLLNAIVAIAAVEMYFLQESGSRVDSGNMAWGILTLAPLWAAAAIALLFWYWEKHPAPCAVSAAVGKGIGAFLLTGHLVTGTAYLAGSAMGMSFLR